MVGVIINSINRPDRAYYVDKCLGEERISPNIENVSLLGNLTQLRITVEWLRDHSWEHLIGRRL